VYAWTQDLDGDLGNNADQELYYVRWNGSGWGAAVRATEDDVADRNVRAAVSESGATYMVWQRGPDLVLDRDFAMTPTVARADSETVGFADYAMTLGPTGNLVLIWQQQSPEGTDAHYTVYDPLTGRWSGDGRLFADLDLERSFAPVWDAAGNLTVAYNRVKISLVTKTVTTEDGETVTLENVPEFGRVDLGVVKRRLAHDVGLTDGDFTVDASGILPGSEVRLIATVRNLGDFPAENVEVAFYDGDPEEGGTEILPRQVVPGFLDGAKSAEISATWVLPEPPARHTLYVVVDPDGRLPDLDRTNNRLAVSLGGTDLEVQLRSTEVGPEGEGRILLTVVNRGAPEAPASVLAVRYAEDPEGTPLATEQVPPLPPGGIAELTLELPSGAVVGERLLLVTVDDGRVVPDIDRANNVLQFAFAGPTPTPTPTATHTPLPSATHTQPPSPTPSVTPPPIPSPPTPSPTAARSCPGDCNNDGEVTIDELIRMVNIALGSAELRTCPVGDLNGDGEITIDEIIRSVNVALNGCPS
jgi:hypothetical protein